MGHHRTAKKAENESNEMMQEKFRKGLGGTINAIALTVEAETLLRPAISGEWLIWPGQSLRKWEFRRIGLKAFVQPE